MKDHVNPANMHGFAYQEEGNTASGWQPRDGTGYSW